MRLKGQGVLLMEPSVCGEIEGMGALAILGNVHLWKALHYMQTSVIKGKCTFNLFVLLFFLSGRKVRYEEKLYANHPSL